MNSLEQRPLLIKIGLLSQIHNNLSYDNFSHGSQVKLSQTLFLAKEFTMIKKIQFSIIEISIEIKTTITGVMKKELKYFPM